MKKNKKNIFGKRPTPLTSPILPPLHPLKPVEPRFLAPGKLSKALNLIPGFTPRKPPQTRQTA